MTDSCLNQTDLRRLAEDGKNKLSAEFIPSPELPHSCMEDKEHLQVYLRIRPLTSAERSNGESQDCVAMETPDTVLLKPPSLSLLARLSSDKSLPQTGQRFQFSRVYGPETTQSELFEGTVKDLVKNVLEGENSLIFTYGITNSGKTFTFLGPDSEAEAGILPRALRLIFSSIGDDVFQGLSVKPHRCREFLALSRQQQADEALFKNSLLKQLRENEKSSSSLQNATSKTWFEGSTAPQPSTAAQDRIILDVKPNTKFSVWVSFCEIYNENILDLLEVAQSGALRRPALRLAQDANSNSYVKDLRWVQVSSAEEAFRVVKLGRRNQSFSSTRLNQLSSRSHSIFSIRILSVEDSDPPRVHTISELCLCDLAGSERCAKTQNKGERLKEAGNINASLLSLGKCIKALRYNQQAKLLQHIPFRESKLTHYLQGFFCGRGRACMIVNINQCASMYDETLNVLKFSAVAQKVVVLISRPLPAVASCSDSSSFRASGRRSAGWETSLEDVPEMRRRRRKKKKTVSWRTLWIRRPTEEKKRKVINKGMHEQVALLRQVQVQLKMERSENLLLEARVREEISREFSELFSDMQKDYDERLVREREILEERAERRLEIFKNLVKNLSSAGCSSDAVTMDRFLSCQASELPGASHFSLGSGPTEKKPEDDQNHEHRADEAEEKKWLLLQLQEKSVQVAQLEQQLEDLKKKTELGSQNSSDRGKDKDQLQEALTALQKEQTKREELMAALEYQTLGKEEALASLQEERRAREEVQSALEESRRQQQELRVAEQVEVQTAVHLQPAVEELEEKIQDQSYQIHVLTEELQQLKQLHMPVFSYSDGCRHPAVEGSLELSKRLEEEKKRSETKQKLIQQLDEERKQREAAIEQQVRELQRKLEEQEELRVQLESQREASNQEAEQLQLKLRLQQEAAKKLRDDLREAELHSNTASTSAEDLHRVNSDLRREITSLKEEASSEMEQMRREKDRQLEEKLAEMERRSAEREAELLEELQEAERKVATLQENLHQSEQKVATLQEAEQKVATLQENLHQSEQKVATLQENLHQSEQKVATLQEAEQKVATLQENLHQSEQKVATLQEAEQKVATLQENLHQSEQKVATLQEAEQKVATLQENLHQSEQKVATLQEAERKVATLQENLHQSEQKVATLQEAEQKIATLQENLQESQQRAVTLQRKLQEVEQQVATLQEKLQETERREEEKNLAVQEVRRKEVERRQELLAVAHEALAEKDAELEKKAGEISRLKLEAQEEAQQVKSLRLELQRKEDDSSDLREKLADYRKQVQQVQKEVSAMRAEETALKQKLSDAEKTKKQLQSDLSSRDRTIQQLRAEQQDSKAAQLYQEACKELQAKQQVMEDMRLALTEQEETQQQMEQVLDDKMRLMQELSAEVEKLKGKLLEQNRGSGRPSDDLGLARDEASRAQQSLKVLTEKQQAERRKWQEEKLSLIGQAKESEDKRNQEMRKFAEDRERYCRQQSLLESRLEEKEAAMESWRAERDTLVAALEVQLQKLLASQADKDKLIKELQQQSAASPAGANGGRRSLRVAELQAALAEKEAEIERLKENLQKNTAEQSDSSALAKKAKAEPLQPERRETRSSASSRGSSGFPSVLESSEVSTETGRTSRFPRPELEISFSPLQPNRLALRRQGDDSAVTVKINRTGRKRKSGEMEKSHIFRRTKRRTARQEEVETENRRNTRTKLTPKLSPRTEESATSQSSLRSRKDGTLQKIGDFLQRSPTVLGSGAKKMMSLVSGRADAQSASSSSSSSSPLRLTAKRSRKKLYRPEISCPMEMPSHPIINQETKDGDGSQQIKLRLRSRVAKC
ncbi:LOW QUALITY PROTEIN: kinesin-like protein KIF20B [Xiphophorus hellerii]|uniref:LOW QUALITY PROTEIN: kinesin-like protein KIF20B n=1 Tax=Xiphophorus hellerii TaxID=8084 RepID=UPI0013B3758C|nr:LOW QUALITY PROTEIN: kinesin-like protein KIF20B [Xiphophorus hellerii]